MTSLPFRQTINVLSSIVCCDDGDDDDLDDDDALKYNELGYHKQIVLRII